MMPVGDVWDEYLRRQGLSEDWFGEVEKFETEVIANRK
jgi:L-rhamnose isomerase